MWRFILGFGTGVYVGSYYECKPVIVKIQKYIKDNMPKQK